MPWCVCVGGGGGGYRRMYGNIFIVYSLYYILRMIFHEGHYPVRIYDIPEVCSFLYVIVSFSLCV